MMMGGDSLHIAMAFLLLMIIFLATNLVTLQRIIIRLLYKPQTTTSATTKITTTSSTKLASEEEEAAAAAAGERMCRLEKKAANMGLPFDDIANDGVDATPSPPPVPHQNRSDLPSDASNAAAASTFLSPDAVINLDHGDPTMFEAFWKEEAGDMATVVIPGWQALSYFSSDPGSVCWFLEPDFAGEVRRLHRLVGNAAVDGKHIVVGTGSTQLFQAALFALCPSDAPAPTAVVSSAPYYSSYPLVTDYLQSRLYYWAGDALSYNGEGGGPYIELVCSPNNPDGLPKRAAVAPSDNGKTIHDLAYYWPQYTAITAAADHDIMLFTVSKSTGHAGTRIGWALVKDEEVARKMTKFIELNSIGVSKDSQLRAAKILSVITDSHEQHLSIEPFFHYGRRAMIERWTRLRAAVNETGFFSLPHFPADYCNFNKQLTETYPAFAWMRCDKDGVEDCHGLLKSHKILTRGGTHFGAEPKYVRVSMLDRDPSFDLFIKRLLSIR